jgi:hypothetical protein
MRAGTQKYTEKFRESDHQQIVAELFNKAVIAEGEEATYDPSCSNGVIAVGAPRLQLFAVWLRLNGTPEKVLGDNSRLFDDSLFFGTDY